MRDSRKSWALPSCCTFLLLLWQSVAAQDAKWPATGPGNVVSPFNFTCKDSIAAITKGLQDHQVISVDAAYRQSDSETWGPTTVIGYGTESVWYQNYATRAISTVAGSAVTVSCMKLAEVQLGNPAEDFLLPTIFALGPGSRLTLTDVTISVSCTTLQKYQDYLCALPTLPACCQRTQVVGQWVAIDKWASATMTASRVLLTCEPDAPDAVALAPVCTLLPADTVQQLLTATEQFQYADTPLVVTVSRNLSLDVPIWPTSGLRIETNVTFLGLNGKPVLDFNLRPGLFDLANGTNSGFLSLKQFVLLNLPLVYLPLEHPRRHFAILTTGLWPVNRDEVTLRLQNCTLVLTSDELHFWQYWLSLLVSPVPAMRQMAAWTQAKPGEVAIEPSGDDYIQIAKYYGKYTQLSNVRYEVAGNFTSLQDKNIKQITNSEKIPPTAVFQVRSADEFVAAVEVGQSADTAAQYGQYIVVTQNITLPNVTVAPDWPSTPVTFAEATTITAWPQTYAVFDLQQRTQSCLVESSVTLKNLILLNMGSPPEWAENMPVLVSGLWFFNLTSTGLGSQRKQIALDTVVMVVSQDEVDFYFDSTAGRSSSAPLQSWIESSQVHSYDKAGQWVYFTYLNSQRFTAADLNITSVAPSVYDVLPVEPGVGIVIEKEHTSHGGVNRQEVLMFSLVAITLPTAIGAAVLTYLWVKRRRISLLCARKAAERKLDKEDEEIGTVSVEAPGQMGAGATMSNPLFDTQEADMHMLRSASVVGPSVHRVSELTPLSPPERGLSTISNTSNILNAELELQRLRRVNLDIGDRQLEVHQSLGWGGSGVVYKGTWKGLPVAVKTVLIQGDHKQSQRHLMEAAISASLTHPNIVSTYLYDLKPLDEMDGDGLMEIRLAADSLHCWKLYIVQEFCDQGTLKAAVDQGWLRSQHTRAPDMVVGLLMASDIAAGLAHIHGKNIVHGDLTASNVLLQSLASRSAGYVAKLADFGLSIKMDKGQTHRSKLFQGTPHYIAPETQRKGILSKAADVYAFGVLLWELYNGTPPWRSHAAMHDSNSGCSDRSIVEPFDFPNSAPKGFVALASSCLEVEPARRPTAEQLVERLQSLQQQYG